MCAFISSVGLNGTPNGDGYDYIYRGLANIHFTHHNSCKEQNFSVRKINEYLFLFPLRRLVA